MKRFNTSDIAFVKQCQEQFNLTLPSVAHKRRRTKFMHTLCCVDRFTWSGRSIHVQCMFVTISVDIALPMYFSLFFCSITICVVFYYHMWWIKSFIMRMCFLDRCWCGCASAAACGSHCDSCTVAGAGKCDDSRCHTRFGLNDQKMCECTRRPCSIAFSEGVGYRTSCLNNDDNNNNMNI